MGDRPYLTLTLSARRGGEGAGLREMALIAKMAPSI
jgi:hypothetical protein